MVCGFSLGLLGVFTSTASAGPFAVGGAVSVTVALPLNVGAPMLVAVTITVEGAGYGVL